MATKTINEFSSITGANVDPANDFVYLWDADGSPNDKKLIISALAEAVKDVSALTDQFFTRAPDYDSGEQTVSVDTRLQLTHSLGALPRKLEAWLRCKTGNLGYVAGEEVPMPIVANSAADRSYVVSATATVINITQGAGIPLLSQSTFNVSDITTSSWRWVVRAWI